MSEMPVARFNFEFEIINEKNITISTAKSTVVFADSISRLPIEVPEFVEKAIRKHLNPICI